MNPQRRRWLLRLAAAGGTAGMASRAAWAGAGGAPGQAKQALAPASASASASASAAAAANADADADAERDQVRRGRALAFPRDHGAHLGARTEWWYATGWLASAQGPAGPATGSLAPPGGSVGTAQPVPTHGFQVTFFRSRTGLALGLPGRFAPRQLLFAHAAVTDLVGQKHLHDQRIVRWSQAPDAATGRAALADGDVHIGDWWLRRDGQPQAQPTTPPQGPGGLSAPGLSRWRTRVAAGDFQLDLTLAATQTPLQQGENGFSRKGPQEQQASHYYSEPQLALSGQLGFKGAARACVGRAWLDHEWSDDILHPEAVGWDWIGMNLFDGSALTAFRLRRADGSALWAGGSSRPADGRASNFSPQDLRWQPGRAWRSPASSTNYPVEWQLQTPVGQFKLRALLDAQELDSRSSTGSIYWEGLSELLDTQGRRLGLGYLEMTGYTSRLRLA